MDVTDRGVKLTEVELIEEYRQTVSQVVLVANLLAEHDIPKLLEAIERADAVGGLLDPTAWMRKHKAMDEDRQVLRAALQLYWVGKKLAAIRKPPVLPESRGPVSEGMKGDNG